MKIIIEFERARGDNFIERATTTDVENAGFAIKTFRLFDSYAIGDDA